MDRSGPLWVKLGPHISGPFMKSAYTGGSYEPKPMRTWSGSAWSTPFDIPIHDKTKS